MSTLTFLHRILRALFPNTNRMESMTLDFPLPLGPITEVNCYRKKYKDIKMLYKEIKESM